MNVNIGKSQITLEKMLGKVCVKTM